MVPIRDAEVVPTTPSPWDLEFERLRARFPGAKPSVTLCVHAFLQRPDINIADLKAQAEAHGLKVSVGSWVAARQMLAPPAAVAPIPDRRWSLLAETGWSRLRDAAPPLGRTEGGPHSPASYTILRATPDRLEPA